MYKIRLRNNEKKKSTLFERDNKQQVGELILALLVGIDENEELIIWREKSSQPS